MRRCSRAGGIGLLACSLAAAGGPWGCGARSSADAGPEGDGGGGVDGGVDGGQVGCPSSCAAVDRDGDGEAAAPCGDDCDDGAAAIHPGAADSLGDGVDQSCDGVDGVDADRDGYFDRAAGGDDCDDGDATIHPGANDGQGWVGDPTGLYWDPEGLRLARDGTAHIAVASGDWCSEVTLEGLPELNHATNRGGAWTTEPIPLDGCVYGPVSVAVDRRGHVHMAYESADLPMYATNESGQWITSPIRLAHDARVSLTLDACDRPVAVITAYGDTVGDFQRDVVVASRIDGEWRQEVVVGTDDPCSGFDGVPSVDVDADHVGVAYDVHVSCPRSVATIEFAESGDVWASGAVSVPTSQYACTPASILRLDSWGGPRVAFTSAGCEGLVVATRDDDTWSRITLEPRSLSLTPGTGLGFAFEIDAADTSHVLGIRRVSDEVREMWYATDAGGAWDLTVLGSAWAFVSMDLDPSGAPAIMVVDADGDLVYGSYRRSANRIDENCDGVDGVDGDHDGHASRATGGDDPDDADPGVP